MGQVFDSFSHYKIVLNQSKFVLAMPWTPSDYIWKIRRGTSHEISRKKEIKMNFMNTTEPGNPNCLSHMRLTNKKIEMVFPFIDLILFFRVTSCAFTALFLPWLRQWQGCVAGSSELWRDSNLGHWSSGREHWDHLRPKLEENTHSSTPLSVKSSSLQMWTNQASLPYHAIKTCVSGVGLPRLTDINVTSQREETQESHLRITKHIHWYNSLFEYNCIKGLFSLWACIWNIWNIWLTDY